MPRSPQSLTPLTPEQDALYWEQVATALAHDAGEAAQGPLGGWAPDLLR